ncbi:Zinc finger CCHC domain-containing protein 24 [Folsomia candida]|uniref:Zinc finger CCHC domain-containing protein 24 n=1 Tax=Folsomia candida TaxID=158441 RepID=A0A226E050_FOLCA|nr:Zinc finger CCHC domain-containing protein 24 [Folsomia candida]
MSTPYQGKGRVFGEFRCSQCNRTWQSGNSWANTGQMCQYCQIMIYPYSQRALEKSTSKIDLNKPHPRNLCERCRSERAMSTPYQGKGRVFGEFRCSQCNRTWQSGNSWANTGQKCERCQIMIYPYSQRQLEKSTTEIDLNKPHPRHLCERCLSGNLCPTKRY